MLSSIRIGFFALFIQFLFAPFLSFAQTRPEALPRLDSLRFMELWNIGTKLFDDASHLENTAQTMQAVADKNYQMALMPFDAAKKDSTSSKALLDSLSKDVKVANTRLKKATKLSQRAEKTAQLAGALTDMDSLSLLKNIPKAQKQINQLYNEIYPALPAEARNAKEGEMTENEAVAEKKEKPVVAKVKPPTQIYTKKYDPSTDVMLSTPTPPCVIAASSRDEFSGEISRETAQAELFRFTNPALKAYLQGKTHVICEAALSSTGAKMTLLLTFRINDPNARKAFGSLEKNSVASIKFLDGSTFELQNAVANDGVFNAENDASIFLGQYPLNPEVLKKIRRTGLDKLRVQWSKGYDDYDVQQVDLLMRQVECLFK
ncbi:MAG: hypothetical protein ACKVU0_18510 [Saprospiraceae bacterium]